MDTKSVLVLHLGGNGSCGTLHLEQLLDNRLPNPCSETDPLLRDLAFREELMPSSVGSISCVPLLSKREQAGSSAKGVLTCTWGCHFVTGGIFSFLTPRD